MVKVMIGLMDDGTVQIVGPEAAAWCQRHDKWIRIAIGDGGAVEALTCEAMKGLLGPYKEFLRPLADGNALHVDLDDFVFDISEG